MPRLSGGALAQRQRDSAYWGSLTVLCLNSSLGRGVGVRPAWIPLQTFLLFPVTEKCDLGERAGLCGGIPGLGVSHSVWLPCLPVHLLTGTELGTVRFTAQAHIAEGSSA